MTSAVAPGSSRLDALPAWARPAMVGAVALGVCVAVNVRDPNGVGSYGTCPFLLVTGWHCPGCGTLRATRALTRGDVTLAADLNLLTTVALPVLVFGWVTWLLSTTGRRTSAWRPPAWLGTSVAVLVPLFLVLRNTPWLAALAP